MPSRECTANKQWCSQALLTHTFRKHDHNHNRDHQPFFVLCRQQVFQAGNNKGVQQTNLQRLVRREVLQRSNQLPPVIGLTTTTTTTTTNKPHSHRLLPTTSTVLPASSSFSSSSPSLSMFVYVYLQYIYIYIHIQGETQTASSLEFFGIFTHFCNHLFLQHQPPLVLFRVLILVAKAHLDHIYTDSLVSVGEL